MRPTSFAVTVPPEITQGGVVASAWVPKVTRRDALSVPAVLRARNLICPVLGGLPLRVHAPDRVVRPNRLLEQPELGIARTVTMTRLVEDLLFDEVAWWEVTMLGFDGFPAVVERRDPSEVQVQPDGTVYVNGVLKTDGQLIRFDSPNPGLLTAAARAIRTCLLLDAAASRYAAEPVPPTYFTPAEGADPEDEEVQAALDAWAVARTTRATGYVGSALKLNTVGMTPEQIQLAESRQHAVLEIARAAGLDAEDLGVSTTSRTYFNAEDRRQAFLDFTLGPYVSAIQDRLSMGDVTPRGSYVRFAFEGFLRTDTLTRYQSYDLGMKVGAVTQDEVRVLEDKPDLTPAQRRALAPAPAPAQAGPPQTGVPVQQSADPAGLTSFTAAGDVVTLAFGPGAVDFKADPEKRTVAGLLLPFNVPTSDGRQIRFAAGSVTWQKAAVSRIKLDREHDLGQLLGSATKVESGDAGVSASFKVARTPAGDEALALAADGALDGLSAVVRITDAIPDPAHEGGTLVTAATLVRATLTADPAFDDARLSSVALTSEGTPVMECTTCHEVHAAGTPCATVPADQTAAFTSAVETFTTTVEKLNEFLAAPQRELVPAGHAVGFKVTEPPVYTFQAGRGPSLVRDVYRARAEGDVEADARLKKFSAQQAELALAVERGGIESFATVNRTVGANVIPPGYRPDLYIPQLFQGRPLTDMLSKGTLSDATPFTIPKFGSSTGATADHVEGTNPTDGTLAFSTSVTVTPGAISGRFRITREIVDASNPAIDAIAANALRESWSQQTEGKVYSKLNSAAGVAGTITAGVVPSDAAVVAIGPGGSVGAIADEGVLLLNAVRQQLVEYPFRRFANPTRLALSKEAATAFALAADTTGRPLLPRIGAMNAVGGVRTLDQAFDVDGLAGVPAWSITGNTAADFDTAMWNEQDFWAWESPLLTFKYEEVAGPANIDLVLFGYFATEILRGNSFSAVRLTVS